MLLGFGYFYKFVMFYFLLFSKTENNRLKKEPVGQNFVIFFFFFFFLLFLKIESVGPVDQQINLVSPYFIKLITLFTWLFYFTFLLLLNYFTFLLITFINYLQIFYEVIKILLLNYLINIFVDFKSLNLYL